MASGKLARGVVTHDPAQSAAVGEAMRFQATQFRPVADAGAGDLAEWDHFGSALLMVGFKDGDDLLIEGSAVMIGPGLALAARHVLDPHMERIMNSEIAPFIAAITGDRLQIWRLDQIVQSDNDVVILRIDLASDLPKDNLFHTAALTTRTPNVGEKVQIAGFRAGEAKEAEVNGEVRVGIGEITAVYVTGRDSVMLPHPCVEVKCLTVGGMSGGPAFDESGMLLGILTSSFEHDEGPSYVSMAFPTFGFNIETAWLKGAFPLPTTIKDLAQSGLIRLERPEAFTKIDDNNSTLEQWT